MIFGLSDLSGAVWHYLDVSVPARGVLLVTSLAGVMFSYTVLCRRGVLQDNAIV